MDKIERKKYQKLLFVSNFEFLLVVALCAFSLYLFLYGSKLIYINYFMSSNVVFGFYSTAPVFTIIPSVILSFVISIFITRKIYRMKLGDKSYDYFFEIQKEFKKFRWDYSRNKRTLILIAILCLIMEIMSYNYYSIFSVDSLTYSPVFSLKKFRIKYQDIDKIIVYNKVKAPNGKMIDKYVFTIIDKNGTIFSSYDALIPDESVKKVIKYVENKSKIEEINGEIFIRNLREVGS